MPRRQRIRAALSAATVRHLARGLFISRLLHPGAAAVAVGPMLAHVPSPGEDRENIPPPTTRQQLRRRSPLPAWYPRAPLQDITSLVNVLEMRRAHTRATLARQRNFNTEAPRPVPLLARLSDLSTNSILLADTGITPPSQSLYSFTKEIEKATQDYVKDKVPDEAAAAASKMTTLMSMR